MLDQLRKMRAQSKTKTAGDQLRSILDTFEKRSGEGPDLASALKEEQAKFSDRPQISDEDLYTPQAKQRAAEALQLYEALSKKAEGEEIPVEAPAKASPVEAEVEVPAPEEGQAAEDMTLEQIAEQYGLTPDEFLDFLSEEGEDLTEYGEETPVDGNPTEEAAPSEEEGDVTAEPTEGAGPEPEDAAVEAEEGEEEPEEVYEEIAKESALKIAAMRLGPSMGSRVATTVRLPAWRPKVSQVVRRASTEESFSDRANRLAKTGQLRLLDRW